MIAIDRLAPKDFPSLSGIHEGFVPPENSIVLIAREQQSIVGRCFLMTPSHLEGPWVREDKRGSTLGYRLVRGMEDVAKSCGISKLFAYAADEVLADYLSRLGYKREPYVVFSKEL